MKLLSQQRNRLYKHFPAVTLQTLITPSLCEHENTNISLLFVSNVPLSHMDASQFTTFTETFLLQEVVLLRPSRPTAADTCRGAFDARSHLRASNADAFRKVTKRSCLMLWGVSYRRKVLASYVHVNGVDRPLKPPTLTITRVRRVTLKM